MMLDTDITLNLRVIVESFCVYIYISIFSNIQSGRPHIDPDLTPTEAKE